MQQQYPIPPVAGYNYNNNSIAHCSLMTGTLVFVQAIPPSRVLAGCPGHTAYHDQPSSRQGSGAEQCMGSDRLHGS